MPKAFMVILIFFLFFLLFSITFVSSTDLSQDLGRHIKIGELIIKTGQIPDTNFFSYTNKNFPFVNHHWFSEVVFYLLSSALGLPALIPIKTFIILSAWALVFLTARRAAGTLIPIGVMTILAPLIAERVSIRPEIFGYLGFAAMLWILFTYPSNKKFLYALPIIMLIWANLHITFIFGFVILGLLGLKIILSHRKEITRREMIIIGSAFMTPLIHPSGLEGLLYPFRIFNNYGYTIVENQTLFFLNSMLFNPHIKYFFWVSPLVVIALVFLLIQKKWISLLLLLGFWLAPFFQIRHMPFFVLAAVVPVSTALRFLLQKTTVTVPAKIIMSIFLLSFIMILSLMYTSNWFYRTFDLQRSFGMKMIEEGKGAAAALKAMNLPQTMFNNFDIGGYAIYALYPNYPVFIDNRPEAYPADFIQNTYIKLQQNPQLRKKLFNQYDIHTVFFAHTDQTPWATTFMDQILKDSDWKLVYLDETMILMTDRGTDSDIRLDDTRLSQLLSTQTNYLTLLKLSRVFALAGKAELSERAFQKAFKMNPSSCALQKSNAQRYDNTLLAAQGQAIRTTYWYCFL